jgi:hypothetical protein
LRWREKKVAKLFTPLAPNVPIVDEDGNPTPYFQRIMQELSDAKISESLLAVLGGDPGEDAVLAWDDTSDSIEFIPNDELLALNDLTDVDTTGVNHGSVLYKDSTSWAVLPAGTAGDVLTTNGASADPTWETPSAGGGGGPVMLSEQTVSGVTEVDFTSLITSTYKHYEVEFWNVAMSTDNALRMRMSTNNGSSFDSSSIYDTALHQVNTGTFQSAVNVGINQNGFSLTNAIESTGAGSGFGRYQLFDPLGTTQNKGVLGLASAFVTDGNFYSFRGGLRWKNTAAYNAIRLFTNSGTMSGTFRLYGIV